MSATVTAIASCASSHKKTIKKQWKSATVECKNLRLKTVELKFLLSFAFAFAFDLSCVFLEGPQTFGFKNMKQCSGVKTPPQSIETHFFKSLTTFSTTLLEECVMHMMLLQKIQAQRSNMSV